MVSSAQGKLLLKLARKAIEEALKHKTAQLPLSARRQEAISQQLGVFVTLLKNSELRGSMGYPEGTYPLADGVIKAARDAAFNDARFKRLGKIELPQLQIRVDVLSRFKPAKISEVRPGKHGVYVKLGPFKALQLPEDAKKFKWTGRQMVENALRRAGLAPEMWNDRNLKICMFTTQAFEEK
ncbi:AmmeMemoRadiSam system protein A [Candidatus Woesearchaeota archaeon]|nr:AmmeMemoRadiSam system protein A [Candidatus Woesearchaeota archaeon]